MNINDLIRGAVRRAPIAPVPVSRQQASRGSGTLMRSPIARGPTPTRIIQSAVRRASFAPVLVSRQEALRGSGTLMRQPIQLPTARGIMPPLATGRSVVSPVLGDRTGILPSSTLATQGAFGGESGGMGAATAGATDLGLGGIGNSISSLGSGIADTAKEYIPLAIKVILAVIVIKIVLWLMRGRR